MARPKGSLSIKSRETREAARREARERRPEHARLIREKAQHEGRSATLAAVRLAVKYVYDESASPKDRQWGADFIADRCGLPRGQITASMDFPTKTFVVADWVPDVPEAALDESEPSPMLAPARHPTPEPETTNGEKAPEPVSHEPNDVTHAPPEPERRSVAVVTSPTCPRCGSGEGPTPIGNRDGSLRYVCDDCQTAWWAPTSLKGTPPGSGPGVFR